MIEVGHVKKLGLDEWRRDMDDVAFNNLAVIFCSEIKPSYRSRFWRKFCCDCVRSYLD